MYGSLEKGKQLTSYYARVTGVFSSSDEVNGVGINTVGEVVSKPPEREGCLLVNFVQLVGHFHTENQCHHDIRCYLPLSVTVLFSKTV